MFILFGRKIISFDREVRSKRLRDSVFPCIVSYQWQPVATLCLKYTFTLVSSEKFIVNCIFFLFVCLFTAFIPPLKCNLWKLKFWEGQEKNFLFLFQKGVIQTFSNLHNITCVCQIKFVHHVQKISFTFYFRRRVL